MFAFLGLLCQCFCLKNKPIVACFYCFICGDSLPPSDDDGSDTIACSGGTMVLSPFSSHPQPVYEVFLGWQSRKRMSAIQYFSLEAYGP